ncbi:MAG: nucleotidyl transferase AbiEii/AbiGii toxin family protein [Chloroflexota bacterium]
MGTAVRFRVTARLAGRIFERFHIDIGYDDPVFEPVEYLTPPTHLDFAGIKSTPIPCYPVSQHIAEKFHALVRPRPVESSRVKDLVDILLFAGMDSALQAKRLYAAIQSVFQAYEDAIPDQLEQIPLNWQPKYNQFTRDLDLPFTDFNEAVEAVQRFINPVLVGEKDESIWNPEGWRWETCDA